MTEMVSAGLSLRLSKLFVQTRRKKDGNAQVVKL